MQTLTSTDDPLFITIMRDGSVVLEETPVTLEELVAGLPQLLAPGDVERVYIRADSLAPYGPVLRVMTTAQRSGVPYALVAEPFRP